MAVIGIRIAEDGEDFLFFGVTDEGVTTQAYRGVDGLHKLLGELRVQSMRLAVLMRYLSSGDVNDALQQISSKHWLVIDLNARSGQRFTFASDDKAVSEDRYKGMPEIRTAISEPSTPRFP